MGVRLLAGAVAASLCAGVASFTFLMLSNRANLGFVPLQDDSWFVRDTIDLYPHG